MGEDPGVATFSSSFSQVTDAAIIAADPSLDGAFKFDFFLSTTASASSNGDLLVVDSVITDGAPIVVDSDPDPNVDALSVTNLAAPNQPGSWFNYVNANGLGSDVAAPNMALFGGFPTLEVDAYSRTSSATPTETGASGPARYDNLNGELYVTHFDSVDNGLYTNFQFASITLIPDANGEASATFSGQIQVRNQPEPLRSNFSFDFEITNPILGCTDPTATNYDPTATMDDGSCISAVNFEDGINSTNPTDDFFNMFGGNQPDPALVAANDPNQYPNGATLFVPTNQAIADAAAAGISWSVADLIVEDVEGALVSNTLGYDEDDLSSLVGAPVGSTTPLTAASGNVFDLERGSLIYGGGLIVETNFDVDNGWIHVIDTIPVPEPGSLPLLLTALIGLAALRRR